MNRLLQIDDDGLTVSVHVSSPPFVPMIPGDALHMFSDGEYGGSRDLRLPAR